jgi:hypothetical protein
MAVPLRSERDSDALLTPSGTGSADEENCAGIKMGLATRVSCRRRVGLVIGGCSDACVPCIARVATLQQDFSH